MLRPAQPRPAMYVCICNAVTERTIREHASRGVATLEELTAATGAGACCGACRPLAIEVLDEYHSSAFVPAAA